VQFVPRFLVRCPKSSDTFTERALLAFQALDLTFGGAEPNEELLDQCGYRGIALSCDYAGSTVRIVIK